MHGLIELRIPIETVIAYAQFGGLYTQSEQRQLLELIPVLDAVYLAWRSEKKN